MKKVLLSLGVVAALAMTSCGGGYSEEAGEVGEKICECVGDDTSEENISSCVFSELLGSEKMQEIAEAEDADKAAEEFGKEVENAIKDKCPDVYDVVKDM